MPGCCRLGWLQRLDDCIVVLQMCMPFDERSPSGDMGMLASNILRYIKYKSTDNNHNIDRQQSINQYIYIYIWSKTSRRGHLLAKPLQQKGFDPGGAWWVLSARAILVGKMMKTCCVSLCKRQIMEIVQRIGVVRVVFSGRENDRKLREQKQTKQERWSIESKSRDITWYHLMFVERHLPHIYKMCKYVNTSRHTVNKLRTTRTIYTGPASNMNIHTIWRFLAILVFMPGTLRDNPEKKRID